VTYRAIGATLVKSQGAKVVPAHGIERFIRLLRTFATNPTEIRRPSLGA
jgi:hypothetical protein